MDVTRRDFIGGSLAALGFVALPGGFLFAAPPGWKHGKKPKLVFGVLSDTHLCSRPFAGKPYKDWPTRYFGDALKYFKRENVDAVVHCGDMAHRGRVRELEFHAEIWRDVFGKNGPVKLFVTGNHEFRTDVAGAKLNDGGGMAANWERIWGEREGWKNAGLGRQGYVVKVYDDMLAIERREFGEGGSLGTSGRPIATEFKASGGRTA